jgi:hypothetical protein
MVERTTDRIHRKNNREIVDAHSREVLMGREKNEEGFFIVRPTPVIKSRRIRCPEHVLLVEEIKKCLQYFG